MNITIRGKSFPGDFYDVEFIERYESCVRRLQQGTADVQSSSFESTADGYRALIRVVDVFFDDVFGDGTAAQIFDDAKGNVRVHLEAVEELNAQVGVQKKGLNDLTNRYTQKQTAQSKVVSFSHGKGKGKRRR